MNIPVHPLQSRYLAQRRSGELAAAAETLKTVLKGDPRADWAYNELIEMLFMSGRRADAETLARTALRVNPLNAQAHNLFGTILSEMNDLPSGEWHFRRAIELGSEQPAWLANLALNLLHQGRTETAETFFALADTRGPGNVQTLAYWSKLAEVRHDLPRALQLLDRAARASSENDVSLMRANHLARTGKSHEALAILDAAGGLNGDARLLRGRTLDRLGRHDEAWRDFTEGKQQLARESGGPSYDAQIIAGFFGRLQRFFVKANIDRLPQAPLRNDVPQPVFIIGFPRSGTTLIEQVLSSHSAVSAGGELPFMNELREFSLLQLPGAEGFPDNLSRAWTADKSYVATLFRDYYLARAEQYKLLGSGKAFFTDKMPFNEVWLPIIEMAFPQARVIRVLRHPLDVCVSMLSHNLTHGYNCGYRIEDIVHHLIAVDGLVDHYRRQMQVDVVELRYEAFVTDQRAQTVRLLDALGLPFEDACLRFHENPRYAPTPSYAQVTERLNDRSIGRHKRYSERLRPFLPQLQPMMNAYGYEP